MASNKPIFDGDDDTEILQFNLTNPEQLTEQLKHADLDDQETDVLLKEAMRINAQLKEALRFQQLEGDDHKPRSRGHNMGLSEPPAPRNPKQSSLPPIVPKGDRSHAAMGGGKPGGHRDLKSKNLTNGIKRVPSASKRKESASNKSRPAWDDRFSFT